MYINIASNKEIPCLSIEKMCVKYNIYTKISIYLIKEHLYIQADYDAAACDSQLYRREIPFKYVMKCREFVVTNVYYMRLLSLKNVNNT